MNKRIKKKKQKQAEMQIEFSPIFDGLTDVFAKLREMCSEIAKALLPVIKRMTLDVKELNKSMGYIDKIAFIKHLEDAYCSCCDKYEDGYSYSSNHCRSCDIGNVITDVMQIANADVQPVKRGEWVYGEDGAHCSECGHEVCDDDITLYCSECGAYMRGEDDAD